MAAAQAFEVVTHFVFEEAALKGTDSIVQGIEKVSGAAKQLKLDIARIGISFAQSFTGWQGGLIGFGKTLLDISMNFKTTHREIANIIQTISKGSHNYQQSLVKSNDLIKKGSEIAYQFAVDERSLIDKVGVMGLSVTERKGFKKSGADPTMMPEKMLDLTRASMKMEAALSMPTGTQMGLRMLQGRVGAGLPAWTDLLSKAGPELKKAGLGSAGDIQRSLDKDPVKAIDDMIRIFDKFNASAEAVKDRVESVEGSLIRLRNVFLGLNSLFLELSMVVNRAVRQALSWFVKFARGPLTESLKALSPLIEKYAGNNTKLARTILEAAGAAENAQKSKFWTTILVIGPYLIGLGKSLFGWAMKFPMFTSGIDKVARALIKSGFYIGVFAGKLMVLLKSGAGILSVFGLIGKFLAGGLLLMGKYLVLFGALFTVFQAVTRVTARFKVEFLKNIMDALSGGKDAAKEGAGFVSQVVLLYDEIVEFIALGIERAIRWMGTMFSGMGKLISDVFSKIWGGIKSLFANTWIGSLAMKIKNLLAPFDFITPGLQKIGDIYKVIMGSEIQGVKDLAGAAAEKHVGTKNVKIARNILSGVSDWLGFGPTIEKKKKEIGKSVTNFNGPININQDFKGELNPDRVAFAFTKEIQKMAQNPTSVSGSPRTLIGPNKTLLAGAGAM